MEQLRDNRDIDLSVLPVKCPVCNEEMLRLTRDHALKHGYESLKQFRKAHDINYLTLAQRSVYNFKRLYNVDFKRWVMAYQRYSGAEMQYASKVYDPYADKRLRSTSKFPMSNDTFNKHMDGRNPLAIFAYGTASRFFAFDIDTKDQAPVDAFKIINQLRLIGISDDDIHVSFSGGKGYHITLFIEKHIKFEDWELFADYIRYKAGLTDSQVEHRPIASNGHALKLPLTFHPTTKNYAGYCDVNTLEMLGIIESHDYLNDIKQMSDASPIFDTIRESRRTEQQRKDELEAERKEQERARKEKEKSDNKAVLINNAEVFQSSEEKAATAKRILTRGLSFETSRKAEGEGKRWLAMRDVLIPFLKIEQGMNEEETAQVLREWTEQEIRKGNVNSPHNRCMKDIDELITDYYPIVTNFQSVSRDIQVTRAEVEWVMSVMENGGTRNARDILWVLLLMSKAYRERVEREGDFFLSRERLQMLLSKPRKISPATITKQRRWLAEHGYIKYHVPQYSYVKRLATVYELQNIGEASPEIIDNITLSDDADGRQLLKDVAEKLYLPAALKRFKLVDS